MGGHLKLPASEAVRARDGEATVQQIARGSPEVARHRLQRYKVSTNILVFQGTSGQFYQKEFERSYNVYFSSYVLYCN
jgi:hypothetical protein